MSTIIQRLFFILFFYSIISFAQIRDERTRLNLPPISPVTFEAVSYFTDDTTSIHIFIFYRISPTFLFFVKSDNSQIESYHAKGELVIEILDKSGAPIARDFRPLQLKRPSIPSDESFLVDDIQGIFTFILKKGVYKIVLEAKDIESGKLFINRDAQIDAQGFSSTDLNISSSIFVIPNTSVPTPLNTAKFLPINRGGNIFFGQSGGVLFQLYSPDTIHEISLSWHLFHKDEIEEETNQDFQGIENIQQVGSISLLNSLFPSSSYVRIDSAQSRFIFIPLPLERLETGKYQLDISVTQATLHSKRESNFTVIWDRKPRSLDDFRTAVEALKYIASEEEIDQMSVFSSTKSRKAFKEYWKKQNPDTTRAYNLKMAEYYRRVDESIKRYSLGNDVDGFRTDRGRIYILFGSPSLTNRLLKPNSAPMEIWTYEKLRKRFVFIDQQKTGNYILNKTEVY
jgi:GWxTD domain-containing protein